MSITIKHLDGPLKGETNEFGDGVATILIGRQADCQIVYPAEYTIIGKTHCQLERQVSGDYCLRLLGEHYVEIDGSPADNLARVPNGATLRLGDHKAGPSFKAEIEKGKAELPDTGQQTKVKSWREQMTETRGLAFAGSGALAVLLLAFVGYFLLRTTSLEQQIASANAAASELAQQQFSQATKDKLLAAVYLVAKQEGESEEAGRLEHADHAGAALHDRRVARHVRLEPRLEPDLAGEVAVAEVQDDRAPDREVDRAGRALRHRVDDRHRQPERVATGERPVHAHERRAQPGGEPDVGGGQDCGLTPAGSDG